MQRIAFSVAVVRVGRRAEIISRPGHLEPNGFARTVEGAVGGKVVAVRHEHIEPDGRQRRTVNVFPLESQ